jgi:hypothetical protein
METYIGIGGLERSLPQALYIYMVSRIEELRERSLGGVAFLTYIGIGDI